MTISCILLSWIVRDHIPLEQGLRRGQQPIYGQPVYGQRPYSIRTRIKTVMPLVLSVHRGVRDHIPLEQGLRRFKIAILKMSCSVRDHIPLEQGLRHPQQPEQPLQPESETIFH